MLFVLQIFARYEKHRQLILEDVLSSLARLPSSKKNLRSYRYGFYCILCTYYKALPESLSPRGLHTSLGIKARLDAVYRLNADEQIQMVTALALQLIQCVVKLPKDEEEEPSPPPETEKEKEREKKRKKEEMVCA